MIENQHSQLSKTTVQGGNGGGPTISVINYNNPTINMNMKDLFISNNSGSSNGENTQAAASLTQSITQSAVSAAGGSTLTELIGM